MDVNRKDFVLLLEKQLELAKLVSDIPKSDMSQEIIYDDDSAMEYIDKLINQLKELKEHITKVKAVKEKIGALEEKVFGVRIS